MTRFDVTFRDYVSPGGWKLSRAMRRLDVSSEPYNYRHNDDADGYSYLRTLSIRPDPQLWTTPIIAAHELAHIVLGHTFFAFAVRELGVDTPIPVIRFEVEAHTVAKAVAHGLKLDPAEWRADLVQEYIEAHRQEIGPVDDQTLEGLVDAAVVILEAGQRTDVGSDTKILLRNVIMSQ